MDRAIVIPCYNEAHRLDIAEIEALVAEPDVLLVFVDDASTDDTPARLEEHRARHPECIQIVRHGTNRGKAAAVRTGFQTAFEQGVPLIGFADADFATPAKEIERLARLAAIGPYQVVMGSRILRLGSTIRRSASRHYVSRFFATLASLILRMPVYDTQCGAKFFKNTPTLRHAFDTPFRSRWAFDVELIGKLIRPGADVLPYPHSAFLEVPLDQWIDIGDSKIRFSDKCLVLFELYQIARDLSRRSRRPEEETGAGNTRN